MQANQDKNAMLTDVVKELQAQSGYFIVIDETAPSSGIIKFHQWMLTTKYEGTILPVNGHYSVSLKTTSPVPSESEVVPPNYVPGSSSLDSGLEVFGSQSPHDGTMDEKIAGILMSSVKFGPDELKKYQEMYSQSLR